MYALSGEREYSRANRLAPGVCRGAIDWGQDEPALGDRSVRKRPPRASGTTDGYTGKSRARDGNLAVLQRSSCRFGPVDVAVLGKPVGGVVDQGSLGHRARLCLADATGALQSGLPTKWEGI